MLTSNVRALNKAELQHELRTKRKAALNFGDIKSPRQRNLSVSGNHAQKKPWNSSVKVDSSWFTPQHDRSSKFSAYPAEPIRTNSKIARPWSSIIQMKRGLATGKLSCSRRSKTSDISDESSMTIQSPEEEISQSRRNDGKFDDLREIGDTEGYSRHKSPHSMQQVLKNQLASFGSNDTYPQLYCREMENLISKICIWYLKVRTCVNKLTNNGRRKDNEEVLYRFVSGYLDQLQTLLGSSLPNELCSPRRQPFEAGEDGLVSCGRCSIHYTDQKKTSVCTKALSKDSDKQYKAYKALSAESLTKITENSVGSRLQTLDLTNDSVKYTQDSQEQKKALTTQPTDSPVPAWTEEEKNRPAFKSTDVVVELRTGSEESRMSDQQKYDGSVTPPTGSGMLDSNSNNRHAEVETVQSHATSQHRAEMLWTNRIHRLAKKCNKSTFDIEFNELDDEPDRNSVTAIEGVRYSSNPTHLAHEIGKNTMPSKFQERSVSRLVMGRIYMKKQTTLRWTTRNPATVASWYHTIEIADVCIQTNSHTETALWIGRHIYEQPVLLHSLPMNTIPFTHPEHSEENLQLPLVEAVLLRGMLSDSYGNQDTELPSPRTTGCKIDRTDPKGEYLTPPLDYNSLSPRSGSTTLPDPPVDLLDMTDYDMSLPAPPPVFSEHSPRRLSQLDSPISGTSTEYHLSPGSKTDRNSAPYLLWKCATVKKNLAAFCRYTNKPVADNTS
ncbi:unnamed protein product [Calicophoron daubneyi]|uniref:Uncharacterized protein n=1 Tax=Calicophoron daubneyi TaxID=300641 RepID=A0AAV2TQK4_CALDB